MKKLAKLVELAKLKKQKNLKIKFITITKIKAKKLELKL